MKYLLIILITFCSCTNKRSSTNNNIPINEKQKVDSLMVKERKIEIVKPDNKMAEFDFTDKNFEIFYDKFKSDSIFQMNHIKFPIKGQYEDYKKEKKWNKKKWPLMTWDFRKVMLESLDRISIEQDSVKFFYGSYCVDCGFSFEMQFDKIGDAWFLTYRQENNY